MADMVTVQELESAKIDARTIGESVNENKIVTPRYGAPFKSMPMIAEEMQSVIGTIIDGGVPANIVLDESGKSQQDINISFVDTVSDFFDLIIVIENMTYKAASGEAWIVVSSGEDFIHPNGAKIKIIPRYGLSTPSIEPQMLGIVGNGSDEISKVELMFSIAKLNGWDVDFRKFLISVSRTLIIDRFNNVKVFGESQYKSGLVALDTFVCPDDSDVSVPMELKVRSIVRIKDSSNQTWSNLNIDGNTQNSLYAFDLLRTSTTTQNTAGMSRNKFERINGNSNKVSAFYLAGGFFIHDRGINPDNNAENTFSHCWFERCSKAFLTIRNRNSLDNLLDHCVMNNHVGATNVSFIETQSFIFESTECGGGGFNVIGGYANIAGGITAANQAANACLFRLSGQLLHDISVHGFNSEDNVKLLTANISGNDSVRSINMHSCFVKGGIGGAYGENLSIQKTGTKELILNLFGGAAAQGRTDTIFNLGTGTILNLYGHILSAVNINGSGTLNFFGSTQTPGVVNIQSTIKVGSINHTGIIKYGTSPNWDLTPVDARLRTINRFLPLSSGEGIQLSSPNGSVSSHARLLNDGNLAVGGAVTYKTMVGVDSFLTGTPSGTMKFMLVNIGGANRYVPFYDAIT